MKAEALSRLFGLDGKLALVTDSGGLASVDVAPLLAQCGATVVIADGDVAGPAGSYITGQSIVLDGGFLSH